MIVFHGSGQPGMQEKMQMNEPTKKLIPTTASYMLPRKIKIGGHFNGFIEKVNVCRNIGKSYFDT